MKTNVKEIIGANHIKTRLFLNFFGSITKKDKIMLATIGILLRAP
jgi:succinyl-CoA synthetase beta subunit